MPTEVLTELIRMGILGPIVVALGWFVLKQQSAIEKLHEANVAELKKLHDARALETQQFIDRLFALNETWQRVLKTNSDLSADTVSTLGSVRETLEAVDETLADVSKQMYALLTTNHLGPK